MPPRLSTQGAFGVESSAGVETESGIDIRRTWQRETESARGRMQVEFAKIRDAVGRGDSLSSALAAERQLFPPLFLEMVEVGEQTGTLGRVFRRLSDHYRHQVQLQRSFLSAITWPMLELARGDLRHRHHDLGARHRRPAEQRQPIDILGFGLVGTRGLVIYINFLIAVGLCVAGARGRGAARRAVDAAAATSHLSIAGHRTVAGKACARAAHLGAASADERRDGPAARGAARAAGDGERLLYPPHRANRCRRGERSADPLGILAQRRVSQRVHRRARSGRGERPDGRVDGSALAPLSRRSRNGAADAHQDRRLCRVGDRGRRSSR